MPAEFDKQVLNTTVMGSVQESFERMFHVKPGAEPSTVEKDIIEYQSRMRVFPMEKFNGPAYVSIINYYRSQKHLEKGDCIGTFLFFIKEEYVEKLLKAFNRSQKDAEDEEILKDICGETCNIVAGSVKNELTSLNYEDLTMSAPATYKNSVPEGAPFDFSLFKKQEITFTYWGQKTVVVEVCMGNVPQKAK